MITVGDLCTWLLMVFMYTHMMWFFSRLYNQGVKNLNITNVAAAHARCNGQAVEAVSSQLDKAVEVTTGKMDEVGHGLIAKAADVARDLLQQTPPTGTPLPPVLKVILSEEK